MRDSLRGVNERKRREKEMEEEPGGVWGAETKRTEKVRKVNDA